MESLSEPGIFMAIGYLIMLIVGVFITIALASAIFDGIQKHAYNNRKKWEQEENTVKRQFKN